MGQALDDRRGSMLGQQKFYRARMEAKFAARVPLADSRADMQIAEARLDELVAVIEEAERSAKPGDASAASIKAAEAHGQALKDLAAYHKLNRIIVTNNQLYGLIIEALGGRRLLPGEIAMLEGLPTGGAAFEIAKWLKEAPVAWLWDQYAKADPVAKNNASAALNSIADLNDTLAMREIVLGSVKNDLTRERCARIPALFVIADDIYVRLENKNQRRALAAHRNLYESACARDG